MGATKQSEDSQLSGYVNRYRVCQQTLMISLRAAHSFAASNLKTDGNIELSVLTEGFCKIRRVRRIGSSHGELLVDE